MIKLNRLKSPKYLSAAMITALTQEYALTKQPVWNKPQIKKPLLAMSNGKCAYCECSLEKESNYMEVEHFQHKDKHPDKVVLWNNLLPSCKKCNTAKSSHDVDVEPMINPFDHNPKDHLYMQFYRLRNKSPLGKVTIDTLNLNDQTKSVKTRFLIGQTIEESLENIQLRLNNYKTNPSSANRNKLLGSMDGMLSQCQPGSEYSATCATVLSVMKNYFEAIHELKILKLWSAQLENLHLEMVKIAFQTHT